MKALIFTVALAFAVPVSATGVFESHDKKPTVFGAVTRASACHDPDDQNGPDGDHDCDDHGVPEGGGWLADIVLGASAGIILGGLAPRRRRKL
jgi:hypothetical protein